MKHEIQNIGKKFMKADYPRPFVNSVISQYSNKIKEQEVDNDDASVVPPLLFEDKKPFILPKLPFCEKNKLKPKDVIKKFHKFTNDNFILHSIIPPFLLCRWGAAFSPKF